MGETTGISWTDSTFNPWWGCQRVSPGCEHCYAEKQSKRFGHDIWGPTAGRRVFGTKHWREPYQWNREASLAKRPHRVFCGSMCDIFEDRPELDAERERLWKTIVDTDNLVWLLLTKRPENVTRMVPQEWIEDSFPEHVWLGVSVENQDYFKRYRVIEELVVKQFLSVEPMLGPVHLPEQAKDLWGDLLWVIVGGESQPGARPMELRWARDLRDECDDRQIAFFMKQLGGYPNPRHDLAEFPADLRIREVPQLMMEFS